MANFTATSSSTVPSICFVIHRPRHLSFLILISAGAEQHVLQKVQIQEHDDDLRETTRDLRVLKCRGASTPSTRFISIREGDGWSLVQI